MRVAVVLASINRPDDLEHILDHLGRQTLAPSLIVLSLEKLEDAPKSLPSNVEVVFGKAGLCAQRNRGLSLISGRADAVVFYDDDYVPSKFSIAGVASILTRNTEVVGATGLVLADGVTSGGIAYENARQIVEAYDAGERRDLGLVDCTTAYGCNMAFRLAAIEGLRFDENLPLYGWQEDVDFAGQIRRRGRMVRSNLFAGVHCGVTRARMPGKRLGFSQIVNPVYLWKKGSMQPSHAMKQMARNVMANHGRAFHPEAHIDRRGRLIGNWLGIFHILSGRSNPTDVLKL